MMMMMKLHKKLLCCYLVSSSCLSRRSEFLIPFSTTATAKHSSSEQPTHFIVDYLITSCGFSFNKAIKASKHLTQMKSASNPDSVLHFLRQNGFSDTQIRGIISWYPRFLTASVEKTLKPKFTALQELGFPKPDLIQMVSKNPATLIVHDLRPKIQFFQSLLGTNDKLLKAFSRDRYLFSTSLDKRLKPNISFLRELGISDSQIAKTVAEGSQLVGRSPSSIEAIIERADEIGVCRSSGMFSHVVRVFSEMRRPTVDVKFKLLRSLGWSEVEIISASRKQPRVLALSEDNIRCKMEFFTKEVGCEVSYLVSHPQILMCSMEKRLIPRWSVLRILEREELSRGQYDLLTAMKLKENKFIEKFVIPHKDKVPGLHEAYVAAVRFQSTK